MFTSMNARFPAISRCLQRRSVHTNAELLENCVEVKNRNPRNLERLRIARKPDGFQLDSMNILYWHRFYITKTSKFITVEARHFENGPVVTASTKEWAIRKFLYSETDISAYRILGEVFARRCLESGIYELKTFIKNIGKYPKLNVLISELEKNGLCLDEYPRYVHPEPWAWKRPTKPWKTFE